MRQFKQVCNRYLTMGRQEFNRGDVVRIVSLSDRDAMILNEDSMIHGFDYVKIEKPAEVKPEAISIPTITKKKLKRKLKK